MKNKLKKIVVILLFVLMSFIATEKSYAVLLEEKSFSGNNIESAELTLDDLKDDRFWYLLCNQHGQPLPDSSKIGTFSREATLNSKVKRYSEGQLKYGVPYFKMGKINYKVIEPTKVCTPLQAYILNYMEKDINSYGKPNDYGKVQVAWYNSQNVSISNGDTTLYNEAKAYQDFVKKIVKNEDDVEKTETYIDMTHQFGDTQTTIKFPELKEDVFEIKREENFSKLYNDKTQKYMIGPFSIKYTTGGSNGNEFGTIENFQIYTDASNEPVSADKWRLVWKDSDNEHTIPPSEEPFYIELDYIENATKIIGMDVDYKYLIAGGYYSTLNGTCDMDKYKLVKKETTVDKDNNNGSTSYELQLLDGKGQGIKDLEAQQLALANSAARWYETKRISYKINEATLIVKKKALDENGKELTAEQVKEKCGEYQYFDFKIRITHNGKTDEFVKTARAGDSVIVGTYTWGADEQAPTYEVEEIPLSKDSIWKKVSISDNYKGTLKNTETVTVEAVNQLKKPNQGYIHIEKKISGIADHDEEFKFKVKVDGYEPKECKITVPKGKSTGKIEKDIGPYTWYGEIGPAYKIIEEETPDSIKYNSSIIPDHGRLKANKTAEATITLPANAYNNEDTEDKHAYLTIEKTLQEGQITDESFTFQVHIEGVKNTPDGIIDFTETLKAGEKRGPYELIYEGDTPPTFTITEQENSEIKNVSIEVTGAENVKKSGTTVTGTVKESKNPEEATRVNVNFTNNMNPHSGNIKVIKKLVSDEKMTEEDLKKLAAEKKIEFEVEVVIEGTFEYKEEKVQNSTKVIKEKLSSKNNWEFTIENVKWWGSKVPTYTVREITKPSDEWDWECIGINWDNAENESTGTKGHNLKVDDTDTVTITNRIPSDSEVDLTFQMAGIVWVDEALEDKKTDNYKGQINGVYDEGETLKENAEVTVYKVIYDKSGKQISREIATAYQDTQGNQVTFPIITKTDGKWDVPRIQVPGLTKEQQEAGYTANYDVEFVYDGQTYEQTEFLSYKVSNSQKEGYDKEEIVKPDDSKQEFYVQKNNGTDLDKSNEFRSKKTERARKEYANTSMAIEVANNTKKITEVSGETQINANGDTTGIVMYDGKPTEVNYSSDDAGVGYPNHSTLNTTDEKGRVLDLFKATATTSAGNLTFPFDYTDYDGITFTSTNTTFDKENGFFTESKYNAVYNYCLHINLGLKRKEEADIGLTKKLTNATVVVKEKMYQYNYSGYYDLTEQKQSSLAKTICTEGEKKDLKFTLGLYRSDYYYRAAMYDASSDKTVYNALTDFYTNVLSKELTDTEMDIYLTYKITLANNSAGYDVVINSIDDYYDSTLSLVTADETKYLKTKTESGKEEELNRVETVAKASDYADKWKTVKENIIASDKDKNGNNINYTKMTANDLNIKLAAGGKEGSTKDIIVTFKVEKENANEAKNAIILGQKCNVAEIANYTTLDSKTGENAGKIDRDSAPGNLNISAYNDKTWYEDDTFAAPRITVDFVAEGNDRTVNGGVWEDNSQDKNTENPGYNQQVGNGEIDSGEDPIGELTTELVEKVIVPDDKNMKTYTEYDFVWPTDDPISDLNDKSINDITKFDSTIMTDKDGKYTFINAPTGDYVVRFIYGDARDDRTERTIKAARYSTVGENGGYYNGQDYKSTRFKGNLKSGNTLQADSYLDMTHYLNAGEENFNTAVDNEARRLNIIANSRELTYENTNIMYNYDEALFKDYWMYADTPKLNINIELSDDYQDGADKKGYAYAVNNINFGVEERPITQLTLDKQIEEIILTTSDGNNIMDAKYIITYPTIEKDGKIKANVELDRENSYGIDNLQSLNRDDAVNKGYRYINVESRILEGTTITVKYKFTVLNTGEVDRAGELTNMLYQNDTTQFEAECNSLSSKLAKFTKIGDALENTTSFGKYVGNIYYYGENRDGKEDNIVTSRVRQIVDYLDTDVQFSGLSNASEDMSWSKTTVEELSKSIDNNIITDGKILDKDGVSYEEHLLVSVDNSKDGDGSTESTLNNGGFIVNLQPYEVDHTNYEASMYLTVTKDVGSDSDDLKIDNVAEIIKYNNKVGRRDELSIAGNQNPAEDFNQKNRIEADGTLSAGMRYERDVAATEVITLSPPTGSELTIWRLQVIASITAGLGIIAGGIVLIKKKILK